MDDAKTYNHRGDVIAKGMLYIVDFCRILMNLQIGNGAD